MRLVVIAIVLASLAQSQVNLSVQSWPKTYVQRALKWEDVPSAGPGNRTADAILMYLFIDRRYMAAQVTLSRGTVRYKTPAVIENEGYVIRAGSWEQAGRDIHAHSVFVHLESLVTPYPGPVDERFISSAANWSLSKGPLRVGNHGSQDARMFLPSAGTEFIAADGVSGVKDMLRDAAAASCYYFKNHPKESDANWTEFCRSPGNPGN